ncbi:MAG: ATP-binding cassette domain-containing protein [Microbacterium sp.]
MRGLDLKIEPGERVLVLGASGAGKSTLLRAIAGVNGDDGEHEGALLVDGADAAGVRGRAGLVLQDPDAQVMLARVGDDIAFGCENLGVPREEIWRRVDAVRAAVGLTVPRERSTSALSGGQKQRLALAGVLAMRPGVVLLDEPTANLDPAGVGEVRDAVDRAVRASGATLIVVEHRVSVWLPVVDRVIVLGPAGVIADGPAERVLAERGEELAAAGVWVPQRGPAWPKPLDGALDGALDGVESGSPASALGGPCLDLPLEVSAGAGGEELLSAAGLAVGRVRGVPAASGLSVSLRGAEVLAITGPNGAGKSTLGLTLAGLLPPVAGAVTASADLAEGARGRRPIAWTSRQLLTRIATVFQSPEHQLLAATVHDELAIGPRALGLADAAVAVRVGELLERLRLAPLARANPHTLSGGEKRRLTVAAALVVRPRVLVLDEPTFGQDARTWRELVALLAEVRDEGSAVVAITHDRDVVGALRARELALPAPVEHAGGAG